MLPAATCLRKACHEAELGRARGQYCSVSNDPGDHRLLREQVRAGDHAAFTALYRDHVGAVFVLAQRLTGSRALAEDVTSDTFLAAWRARDSIEDHDRPLLPWLLGITARQSLNATRSIRRRLAFLARRPGEVVVDDFSDETIARIDDAELIRRTQAALAQLTRAESEVLALCVWSGLTYAEAAEALEIPIGTVRSRLARARTRLRTLSAHETTTTPTTPTPCKAATHGGRA
ncbi:RNA polymerase sigma factor [Nocardioides sp.]|uniref:RNA polymerase sigma factor n=1 Tax=Nocardioides sp. TaxID=35761 RepID=UPI00286ABDD2|nr:RNA polymerase sigma factor [Nocardioides sp.]